LKWSHQRSLEGCASLASVGGKTWSVSAQTTLAMLSIVVSSSRSSIAQVRDCARDCVSGLLSMKCLIVRKVITHSLLIEVDIHQLEEQSAR
jgi:hypothetical protein